MKESPKKGSLLNKSVIEEFISSDSFYTQYQPIIVVETEEVYAYEALARFPYEGSHIAPDRVFEFCHHYPELFFKLEYRVKQKQFGQRPQEKKLFVNFDPHIFLHKGGINDILYLFSDKKDFVIELIENSHTCVNTNRLIHIFKRNDFIFAIDDFFKENSMISISLLNCCDYLKLDKDILSELKRNEAFFHIAEGIVQFAHTLHKKVILEGIEDSGDFAIAKRLNVDLIQGFYYKEKFIDSQ